MPKTELIKGMTKSDYLKDWRRKNPGYSNVRLRRLMQSDPVGTTVSLIFRNAKHRARRRGIPFDIEASWLEERLDGGKCDLTGLPFIFEVGSPYMPSLDRITSHEGYTAKNCRVIIWFANQAKSDLDDREFLGLLRRVVQGITATRRRPSQRRTR